MRKFVRLSAGVILTFGALCSSEIQADIKTDSCTNCTISQMDSQIRARLAPLQRCPYADLDDCYGDNIAEDTWFIYDYAKRKATKFRVEHNQYFREIEQVEFSAQDTQAFAYLEQAREEVSVILSNFSKQWRVAAYDSKTDINRYQDNCDNPNLPYDSVFDYFSDRSVRDNLHNSLNNEIRRSSFWERITSFNLSLFSVGAGAEWVLRDSAAFLTIPDSRANWAFRLIEIKDRDTGESRLEGELDLLFSHDADGIPLSTYIHRNADGNYRITERVEFLNSCEPAEFARAMEVLYAGFQSSSVDEEFARQCDNQILNGNVVSFRYSVWRFYQMSDGTTLMRLEYDDRSMTVNDYEDFCDGD